MLQNSKRMLQNRGHRGGLKHNFTSGDYNNYRSMISKYLSSGIMLSKIFIHNK